MITFKSIKRRLILWTIISAFGNQPLYGFDFSWLWQTAKPMQTSLFSTASTFTQENKWPIATALLGASALAIGYKGWRSIKNLKSDITTRETELNEAQANLAARTTERDTAQKALNTESIEHDRTIQERDRAKQQQEKLFLDKKRLEREKELADVGAMRVRSKLEGTTKNNQLLEEQIKAQAEGPQAKNHIFVQAGLIKNNEMEWAYDPSVLQEDFKVKVSGAREFKDKTHRIIYETITPPNHNPTNSRILLVCVHGTFANDKEFGQNPLAPLSQELMTFAKGLALTHKCEVEIAYYRWTGELSPVARTNAGTMLGSYLSNKTQEGYRIMTVAHSHGCNVVAWAAEELKKTANESKIEIAIQLAWPAENASAPWQNANKTKCSVNIDKIFHFYSEYDLTQVAGSIERIWWPQRKANQSLGSKIYNIHTTAQETQANTGRLDHISIKVPTVRNLFGLIFKAEAFYDCYTDLSAGIFAEHPEKLPIMLIREDATDCERTVRENLKRSRNYNDEQLALLERNGFRCARFRQSGGWFATPHIIKLVLGETATAWAGDVYSAIHSNLSRTPSPLEEEKKSKEKKE